MINYLKKRLKGQEPSDFKKHYICYDNICNVDRLKLLRGPLPIEEPFPKVWQEVGKVIDPLHLSNHKNPECQIKYNPSKVKEQIPDANLMVAEQTFSWLGKYRRSLNAMPKYHQLFLLHRLVQRRNKYNEFCHSLGKKPMLPSLKEAKNK